VKFNLIDKIESLDETRIVARKSVSLAEEYLQDHFPTFPVLPGVMMLEALTQAATWLMHKRTGFAKTMCVLKEARNVRYGQFVEPGQILVVDVEFFKATETGATFKAAGSVEGQQAVSARIELAYFNLAEKDAVLAPLDKLIAEQNQERWIALTATGQPGGVSVQI
jgi:3-hydroxyacyl-[acyl-carrier-protein] dehydratase